MLLRGIPLRPPCVFLVESRDPMRLTRVTLEHYRRFKQLEIQLGNAPIVVLIGNNGAGKSSILEGVAKGLSWLTARIRREHGTGRPILLNEIFCVTPRITVEFTVEQIRSPLHH
ncbi:hypothetical protein Mmc1_3230 [Magnetococcus marinus MC-1]|uniref:Rad50/SbcC-type AAA domain-containing protein n=2 Tax=Magnetococcus TaxID=162171 RepID=A0LCM7_MAGMM|nr:hypothetical protein Mmc1_3230 [Magnetococcus marinus MC-1]